MLSSYTAFRWIANLIFGISKLLLRCCPLLRSLRNFYRVPGFRRNIQFWSRFSVFSPFPNYFFARSGLHPARPPTLRGLEGLRDHGPRHHRPRSSLGRGAAIERLRRWEHKVKHVVLDRHEAWVKRLSRLHNQASTTNKQPNGETHNSPSC